MGFFEPLAFQGCEGVEGARMEFIVKGGGEATIGVDTDVNGPAAGNVTL